MCFSPFEVHVGEEAGPQKVRAWGPGLETGVVGKSADFVVEAIGTEVGTLGRLQSGTHQGLICNWIQNVQQHLHQNAEFTLCSEQVSLSRVHLRPRSSVTTKVTGHVMFDTGQQNQETTLSTSYVTTRTSRTVPSWLTSSPLPTTSSLSRSEQTLTGVISDY